MGLEAGNRGDDVVLVISGDGDEGVHVHDPFGGQQVVVGTVPLNDEGVGKGQGVGIEDLEVESLRQRSRSGAREDHLIIHKDGVTPPR